MELPNPLLKAKGKSRYDQLDEAGHPKVTSIANARAARTRVSTSILTVVRTSQSIIISADGWRFDASRWLSHPEIADAVVWGLSSYSSGQQSNTMCTRVGEMDRSFWCYLWLQDPEGLLTLKDINTRYLSNFVRWLDRKGENKAPVWSVATKNGVLTAFRRVFKALISSEQWASRLETGLQLPSRTWSGAGRKGTPRQVIDDETLTRLLLACRQEVLATKETLIAAWAEMDALDENFDPESVPTSAAEWRAVFKRKYTDRIPHYTWISRNDSQLRSGLKQLGNSPVELRRPLMPMSRDLVPYVLLLALPTSFNPHVLRGLDLEDIDYPDDFGGSRIRFRSSKGRSSRRQIRTFAIGDPLGPDALVAMVEAWTTQVRQAAPAHLKTKLFIFYSPYSDSMDSDGQPITSLAGGVIAQKAWYTALKNFLEEHSLPKFTLAQLRPTSLDLIHELTDGDLKAVQTAGNQRSPQVILDHYTSDAARLRNNEKLAAAMQTRDRLVQRQGAVADPRMEPQESDMGCATPGFNCLDPFASPWLTEIEGRMCQAYGMCPACPLACINVKSGYVAARLLQLRTLVEVAQIELEARRWTECWRPIGERLDNYWLRLLDDVVLVEASKLTLPPLPTLE
ncbi:hypothetical protein [Comamonas sp.]|uniref:hypothetical protein n=1 Tax=Comamonas sp. TaxID=34028 RepID=UPI002897321B|nr:hypothetical protein [Comamonas sp.]